MTRTRALLVTSALLAAGPLAAQPQDEDAAQPPEAWDADGDGALSREEWRSALRERGLFGEWDADDSGRLSGEELARALYARFDGNDDGELTVEEARAGFDRWRGAREAAFDLEVWDEDGDGAITEEAFVESFKEAGLFDELLTLGAGSATEADEPVVEVAPAAEDEVDVADVDVEVDVEPVDVPEIDPDIEPVDIPEVDVETREVDVDVPEIDPEVGPVEAPEAEVDVQPEALEEPGYEVVGEPPAPGAMDEAALEDAAAAGDEAAAELDEESFLEALFDWLDVDESDTLDETEREGVSG